MEQSGEKMLAKLFLLLYRSYYLITKTTQRTERKNDIKKRGAVVGRKNCAKERFNVPENSIKIERLGI